ncbi:MAG: hypothetical protein J6K03_01460 [Oscillospiraceae bacterium]|nr:hypothetical protein [Oscillospiraceae bacterium]
MKSSPKTQRKRGQTVSVICTGCLEVMALALFMLYALTGYVPLLSAALIIALPAFLQLVILLPRQREGIHEPVETLEEPEEPEQPAKKRAARKGSSPIAKQWARNRIAIQVLLLILITAAIHAIYWLVIPAAAVIRLAYYVPVALAALVVGCIALEKWCRFASEEADTFFAAVLRSLASSLRMSRFLLILLLLASLVELLGLFETCGVMAVILGVLIVYETVSLAFFLAARIIRKEMDTSPELMIALPGKAFGSTNLLTYMEENTGITMRSLWSIRFIRQVLPTAVVILVLTLWLSTSVVLVDTYQEGALFRMGTLQSETLAPGMHFVLPWPFDRVELHDTRSINAVTIGYVADGDSDNLWTEGHGKEEYRLLLGSGDEMVSINLRIQYRIRDLYQYISSAAEPAALLQAQAYEIVTSRTVRSDLETLLSTDREAFSQSFLEELTQKLEPFGTGLEVVDVVLESIHPPVEVASVYQRIISAGIDAERIVINGENEAQIARLEAQLTQTALVSKAKVEREQAVAAAKAAVADFMASVEADGSYRDAYRYYKYIDALTKAYADAKLIIIGEGVDSSNLFIGSISSESQTNTKTEAEEEGY